jgi:cobyrinic acid a,c-diamide synthase
MGLVIGGERSGVGKTTVTISILAYLTKLNLKIQSFKSGPDYIDPMFHQYVTGRSCRNLDPILTSENYVKNSFKLHTQDVEYALVEGVMGLYDGIPGNRENGFTIPLGSTAHIAYLLDLPILLVIDCSRLSGSVAAIAEGFRRLSPEINIAGVVLNRVASDRHLELLQDALESLNFPILGVLRRQDEITIPDRHLGLIPVDELANLSKLIDKLAALAQHCFNWEKLLPLIAEKEKLPEFSPSIMSHSPSVKIAVARDTAFSFYYQDNLDLLEELGAELIFWSPLNDHQLPPGIQGLYFGGGFPEVFAEKLAQNLAVIQSVKQAILSGIPTYAECGGLMYLCDKIRDFQGKEWSMIGIFSTIAVMGNKLSLGYRQAVSLKDTIMMPQNTTVIGHEFHRSSLTISPQKPIYQSKRYNLSVVDERSQTMVGERSQTMVDERSQTMVGERSQTMVGERSQTMVGERSRTIPRGARGDQATYNVTTEGWSSHNIHASYLHLHWGNHREIPTRFIEFCRLI